MKLTLPFKAQHSILALGSEYDTRLAFFRNGEVVFSENTNGLAENFGKLENFTLKFLNNFKKPDVIITDLHPLYNSRKIGENLAKKWKIKHFVVQHHIAHIFAAMGEYYSKSQNSGFKLKNPVYGIACDGTGYGLDGKIWGGEVFKIKWNGGNSDSSESSGKGRQYSIKRIGHLEEQYLLGGEFSVEEPARMLISILFKFLPKADVFRYAKKYYSENDFEVLYNQWQAKFNCPVTTSTARVLDAVSLLLGFCENQRKEKHYPIKMMEKYSAIKNARVQPISPKIEKNKSGEYVLNTTSLFEYLIRNIKKDKKNLAFEAQRYIIEGLSVITNSADGSSSKGKNIFLGGGLSANNIMRQFALENKIYIPEKIFCGDEGIALGQIIFYLINGE